MKELLCGERLGYYGFGDALRAQEFGHFCAALCTAFCTAFSKALCTAFCMTFCMTLCKTLCMTFFLGADLGSSQHDFVIFFVCHSFLLNGQKFVGRVVHANALECLLDDSAAEIRKFTAVPGVIQ